ncbi:hypothetical protein [Blastococcus haudaquaticus]|uniref:LPXTG-motif cell wall anchor domain-containing protein n=1 Tax=Blastococcus haudaquaticus TaxID=1938745 RepID=A0A286H4A4_9ACTN|nr:hypothetical protein [Blastococcus haudaquaticus]SOE02296.1 hypothetical protein SAMN06272739_3494 [Blastococcus haudaquaticus]
MSIRPARRALAVRAGGVLLASLIPLAAWVPAAQAAPAATIVLDPGDDSGPGIGVRPIENLGPLDVTAFGSEPVTPVDAGWSGSVTVELPAVIDGAVTQAQLFLYPTLDAATAPLEDDTPTRVYDSESTVPADQLTFTDLGSNRFQVDIPADDTVNGPYGRLLLKPLSSTIGVLGSGSQSYVFDLAAGVSAVTVTPQTVLSDYQDATVDAGDTVEVVLPADSLYSTFGFTSLTPSAFALLPADGSLIPTAPSGTALTGSYSGDGRSASLVIPAGTAAGKYLLAITLGNGTDPVVSRTFVRTTVTTPSNDGLTSNTGWTEPAGDEGASPLVPIGAGMVLVAGIGAAAVLRRRTSHQE